nr:EpsG family protein [Pseudoxanthomonas gei]
MFLVAACGVLVPRHLPAPQARVVWWTVGLIFALLIGLRHEVGADWFNYLGHFNRASQMSFAEAASMVDPGHYVLNMWVARLGGEVHGVNLIYALVLMWGAIVFCRSQPNPWLALLAAVPYMLIVVGMGYTRQSVALGLALLGLVALGEQRIRTFVICVAVGALFHKSAVLLLPIAALASSRNRFFTGAMVLLATGLMYYLVLADSADTLWTNYVEAERQSQGGAIRVAMNAVPALLMLLFGRRLVPDPEERKLWLWLAVFALACIPFLPLSSTAVDRVALYLIPLQLFVFARLPRLAATTKTRTPLVLGVVAYYATVQYVWLNLSSHSEHWLPYQFIPLT